MGGAVNAAGPQALGHGGEFYHKEYKGQKIECFLPLLLAPLRETFQFILSANH
jgi:hypothetical protein